MVSCRRLFCAHGRRGSRRAEHRAFNAGVRYSLGMCAAAFAWSSIQVRRVVPSSSWMSLRFLRELYEAARL